MKRDAAQTIFRTVVFAGAMLGAGACAGKKPVPTQPGNAAEPGKGADPAMAGEQKPSDGAGTDPCADPCAGGERPRGTDEDGGGGTGRGFILS